MLKLTSIFIGIFYSGTLLAQGNLPERTEQAFNTSPVPASALSAVVIAADAQTPVLSQNAGLSVSPASTMKLLTTLVALEELGPVFRWKTRVYAAQALKKDSLNGNLYLKGGGDPNFTQEKLSTMLRNLRNQGLRKIQGDIVLDRSYFQPERPDVGAPAFDESPDAYYNVIPDALLVNSNISAFTIDSANQNKIDIRLLTPLDKLVFANHLHFNDKPCSAWESEWLPPVVTPLRKEQLEIRLAGGFPRNCKVTANLNLLDRNQYIAHMIRNLWQEMGGSWRGQVIDGTTPENAILLTEQSSETLADTIRIVNKHSDNAMARILYLTLGAEASLNPGENTAQAADRRIRNWLARHQISDQGLVLENGSGLSRNERITANQLAGLLQVAAHSNWNPEFMSSLPIAALDGTMRKRLKGSAADSRARIKTGTLKNSVAIAGYVRDNKDQQWIVVGIINHEQASKAKAALDELIQWVAAGRP